MAHQGNATGQHTKYHDIERYRLKQTIRRTSLRLVGKSELGCLCEGSKSRPASAPCLAPPLRFRGRGASSGRIVGEASRGVSEDGRACD